MQIVFPELAKNPLAKQAAAAIVDQNPDVAILPASDLNSAVELVKSGQAHTMISGLDYPSRDVLLAYKSALPLKSQFFSSCFVCEKPDHSSYVLADGGVNKQPTADQLYTIVEDSATTYETYYNDTPRIAMLSYSTKGSGGQNPDLAKIHTVIEKIRKNHPDWHIDGEMQLDAAIIPEIGAKKFGGSSEVAGRANVLITPDLNSGNLMYKTMEHLGGWTMAGPIIQGFAHPVTGRALPLADLSRGSSLADILLTLDVIIKLTERASK